MAYPKNGNTTMTSSEQLKLKITQSISFKLGIIFILMLVIQWPLSYVGDLIGQRQGLQYQANTEIAQRWGPKQYIGTPMLSIEVLRNKTVSHNQLNHVSGTEIVKQLYPSKKAHINVELNAEKRYLGIYEAAVFQSKISLSGTIVSPDTNNLLQGKWTLFVPVKHLRGLKKIQKVLINGRTVTKQPVQNSHKNITGFSIDLSELEQHKKFDYVIDLTIAGSEQFEIMPTASQTSVNMQSNWPSPSFFGDYLPDQRNINKQGFDAQWQVNRMLENWQSQPPVQSNERHQNLTHNYSNESHTSTFGVKVMIAANIYQVNERTIKYSFLIVMLSFAAFFLAELFFQLRLHPFHYLIIGIALSLFYLLLLSLSEFLRYDNAFMIAASATTLTIGAYCSVVLKQRKRGLLTALFFAVLYGFIYVLVKAEQTSLLMGSIAIWLVVVLVMYLTRKVDWYSVSVNQHDHQKQP